MSSYSLVNALSAIHSLSDEFRESLEKELIPLSLPKHHMLLEAPRVAEFAYFVKKGFAMSFSYDDGKKIIEGFWKAGQIMTIAASYYNRVPSVESIQLMEKTDLLCLSRAGLDRLFEQHMEAHYLYHKIMNCYYSKCRTRIHEIQRLSALERFDHLLVAFPEIEQLVPQENIASYLSITPQSLSRLKRERR